VSCVNPRRDRYEQLVKPRHERSSLQEDGPPVDEGSDISASTPRNTEVSGSFVSRYCGCLRGIFFQFFAFSDAFKTGTEDSLQSGYYRGVVNIIDPIKQSHNIARSVDVTGFHAIHSAFLGAKEYLSLFHLSSSFIGDVPTVGGYNAFMDMLSSCKQCSIVPESDAAASKNIDVPFVRSFLVNTTSALKNAGRGRIVNPEIDVLSSPLSELEVCKRLCDWSLAYRLCVL
jgi:hypothetical protein